MADLVPNKVLLKVLSSVCESSLFLVNLFNAVPCGKQFEFLHRDCFFTAEVPPYEVFKLAFCELKSTALNESFEVYDSYLLCRFMLDTIEKTLQKLIVLLFVRVLV